MPHGRTPTSKYVLAAVFIAWIALVTLTQLHTTITQTHDFLNTHARDGHTTPTQAAYIKTIDDAYSNVLTYNAPFPFINRGSYINLNGYMANAMGAKELNGVIKLSNGRHAQIIWVRDVTQDVVQITKLSRYMDENGGSFLFVNAPSDFSVSNEEFPTGYRTFTNLNIDAHITALQQNNVPTLDLRENALAQGLSPADLFFSTDHHWTVKAGFWGYTQIIERLTADRFFPKTDALATLTDVHNYHIETFHNVFLGSYGRRTGHYFSGLDDFDIFTPLFDTQLTVTLFPGNEQKSGSFYDVCYSGYYDPHTEALSHFVDRSWENFYGYWQQAQQGTHYHNENAPVNKRVLVIGDSFTNFPNAFFALTFTDFAQIYFNRYHWDGSNFEQFVAEFAPELIIFLTSGQTVFGSYNVLPSYHWEVQ